MGNEATKKTAPETSVGADEGQSSEDKNSIPEKALEINDSNDFPELTLEQIQEEMRKMSDPAATPDA